MFYYALVQKLKLECGIWQRELQFDTLYHTKKKKSPFSISVSAYAGPYPINHLWLTPHYKPMVSMCST